jgi:hypothetical protein
MTAPMTGEMTAHTLLLLVLLFQVKHFLADFLWQTDWMFLNKGRYGHPGGLAHAGLHALLTAAVLLVAPVSAAMLLALAALEFVIHYHVDWSKDHFTRRGAYTVRDKAFWVVFGIDQAAHQLTYVLLLYLLLI